MRSRTLTNAFLLSFLGLFIVLAGQGCTKSDTNTSTINSVDNTTPATGTDDLATTTSDDITADIRESDTRPQTPTASRSQAAMSYAQAVAQFGQSGYRYQFANCSGLPGRFTIKKGVRFMLDNRDSERHTLRIGSRNYAIPAYGYAIVTVNAPGRYTVTCDGGGSAEVIVQN